MSRNKSETNGEEKNKCFQLCQDYLEHRFKYEDFNIERLRYPNKLCDFVVKPFLFICKVRLNVYY